MTFKDDEAKKLQVDKMKEQAEKTKEQFRSTSVNSVGQALERVEETDYDSYVDGLEDYLNSAEKAGVEVYTSNKTPISVFGIYYSKPFATYHQEFKKQNQKLKEKTTEGQTIMGLVDTLKSELGVLYLGLFGVFTTMVLILVMNKWALGKEKA